MYRLEAGAVLADFFHVLQALGVMGLLEDDGCGQATRKRKVTDKHRHVHEIEGTLYCPGMLWHLPYGRVLSCSGLSSKIDPLGLTHTSKSWRSMDSQLMGESYVETSGGQLKKVLPGRRRL